MYTLSITIKRLVGSYYRVHKIFSKEFDTLSDLVDYVASERETIFANYRVRKYELLDGLYEQKFVYDFVSSNGDVSRYVRSSVFKYIPN